MLPLRYVRHWQIAGVLLLILVLAATLMPAVWFWPSRREFAAWYFDVDKWFRSYWKIGVGLIFFGLVIEGCQRLVTYRSAEMYDVAADIVGIVIGLVIAGAGLGGWSVRVEGWLVRRRENLG